ncbi:uncharacterized protein LOC122504726 [Leptopilina heterotoma]|uniref:uncharacterized protein LOC122504726 n=1 Tax=Leptopilina heterotoma TaxID=63436 RepID=UPI001CA80C20|nr:uncharacterized protein LOC122504726 [Leptopilina heterotoma]
MKIFAVDSLYNSGDTIHVKVEITANHKGHFQFQLCPLNNSMEMEEEECFEKYPLPLVDGSYKYALPTDNVGFFETDIILPKGISCDHCVLRWEYIAGNNWGTCADGLGKLGCGPQETFKNCSDISIINNFQ